MDATTLTTFFLRVPPHVCTVELLGSWDNFSRPYRLRRDFSRGKGTWAGCHTFDNIVFDGDTLDWSKPRIGALKQSGRYWYYYRLDDTEEYCDPARPMCSSCPLLPGQTLNLLDIPMELDSPPLRSHSVSFDKSSAGQLLMTLDPEDRYKKVSRQPLGKLGRHYASTDDLRSQTLPSLPDASPEKSSLAAQPEPSPTKFGRLVRHVKSFTRPRASNTNPTGRGSSSRKIAQPIVSLVNLPTSPADLPDAGPYTPALTPATGNVSPFRPSTRSGDNSGMASDYFNIQPSSSLDVLAQAAEAVYPARTILLSSEHAASSPARQGLGISVNSTESPAAQTPVQPLRHKRSRNFAAPFYTSPERPPPIPSPCTPATRPKQVHSGMDFGFTCQSTACPSPLSEIASFDIASPTFTEDTIETPGFGTPHRLSDHFIGNSLSPVTFDMSFDMDTDSAVATVERRLSHLTTIDDSADTIHLSPFVTHSDATSSEQTLKKLATPRSKYAASPAQTTWLSSPVLNTETYRSSPLTNNIFGELGFLGKAIT
ncbi:hypothetical protein K461DRAFT_323406 [Myriangium duriaei CBS 260.36]|uniref:Uncharacterized protein n=1 Tax=Myriangium duriaei CBS 260.36 TaxID=1168546 RepID=A0A9P4ITU7_9PEZI|nr:hypothetical protein K461DRAFT_323406 [Myriangium duriaei CBS 260.36]